MFSKWNENLLNVLSSGTSEVPMPKVDDNHQSNVHGLYIIGDLTGAPVIKLAMEQGFKVINHIVKISDIKKHNCQYDVVIVGAGASGLNAALQAQEMGLKYILLEKETIASTIENFPEGKWIYAEPDIIPPKGKLWLDGASKEDLLARWNEIIKENNLSVKPGDGVNQIIKEGHQFKIVTEQSNTYTSKKVVLATGQRGNPRKLKVAGEEREKVYHRLYSPKQYVNEDIIVIGGGNSAIEAALVLSEKNRVVLSYRQPAFSRLFKDNERKLQLAINEDKIKVILNSNVKEFSDDQVELKVLENNKEVIKNLNYDHAFVLIGAALPIKFLKKQNINLDGEWTGNLWRSIFEVFLFFMLLAMWKSDNSWYSTNATYIRDFGLAILCLLPLADLIYKSIFKKDRFAGLAIAFIISYSIYGIKLGSHHELWPFQGWGYETFSFLNRPWPFWYTVIYSILILVFGIQAINKWGLKTKDKYQIFRYISLIFFQWVFFLIIPEFLFQYAIKYQWVGEQLANNSQFTSQAWRAYGIVLAWPLFFFTFFYDPHQIWIVWGIVLTFLIIPIYCYFNGKKYCSWICGCGGLAETLGDRWRHYAPKGKQSIIWEKMQTYILIVAFVITALVLLKDVITFIHKPALASLQFYKIFVDVWLVGIIPLTLYPFLGNRIWCRYWCPLAKLMEIYSKKLTGKFAIHANEKCISCYQCSRYCQVGIPVMQFALKQESFGNYNSSCIGCGICVTVCPMDTLSFKQNNPSKEIL